MATTHTPGPWFLKNRIEIHDRDTHFNEGGARIGETANLIATVDLFNTEANARLIAAAPDLLNKLRTLANVAYAIFGDNPEIAAEVGEAYSAIAKAEGRA